VTQFVLYKAGLGVVLGAIVTPVIALLAMADRSEPPLGSARQVAVSGVELPRS
jgi:hypothetical protein